MNPAESRPRKYLTWQPKPGAGKGKFGKVNASEPLLTLRHVPQSEIRLKHSNQKRCMGSSIAYYSVERQIVFPSELRRNLPRTYLTHLELQ